MGGVGTRSGSGSDLHALACPFSEPIRTMQTTLHQRPQALRSSRSSSARGQQPRVLRVQAFAAHPQLAAHARCSAPCSTSYAASRPQPVRVLVRCRSQQTDGASTHPFPEEEDFDLLSNRVADLTKELNEELRGCSIYLVGMMGSGKSTVGGPCYPCKARSGALGWLLLTSIAAFADTGWQDAFQHAQVRVL